MLKISEVENHPEIQAIQKRYREKIKKYINIDLLLSFFPGRYGYTYRLTPSHLSLIDTCYRVATSYRIADAAKYNDPVEVVKWAQLVPGGSLRSKVEAIERSLQFVENTALPERIARTAKITTLGGPVTINFSLERSAHPEAVAAIIAYAKLKNGPSHVGQAGFVLAGGNSPKILLSNLQLRGQKKISGIPFEQKLFLREPGKPEMPDFRLELIQRMKELSAHLGLPIEYSESVYLRDLTLSRNGSGRRRLKHQQKEKITALLQQSGFKYRRGKLTYLP